MEKELEKKVKKEFKEYKKDIMSNDVELYDDKPLIQKVVFFLVGVINCVVGFALYFLIKDDKNKKWQASYLSKGSLIGLALWIIIAFAQLINLITYLASLL